MEHSNLKYIKIQIQLPKDIWIGKLSSQFPDCSFQLNYGHAISKQERLIFIYLEKDSKLNQVYNFLNNHEDILDLEIIGNNLKVHFKLDFLSSIMHDKLTFIYPITVKNNIGYIELLSNPNKIKLISKFFPNLKILNILDNYSRKDFLTTRQKEILDRAFILGYFNYPRKISLTDLAKELKISKSTLSENLRIAENKIISEYITKNF